jgi:hypothetical protein
MLRFGWLLLLALAACGHSSGTGATGANATAGDADVLDDAAVADDALVGEVSCADDTRVDHYTANLKKPGQKGVYTFQLSQVDPAPPVKGTNTFVVKVLGANQMPVGGELRVNPTMPDHGHGTSVKAVVTFDASTSSYTVKPLYLFMSGVWRIQLDLYAGDADAGPPTDTVAFFFCIDG